MTSLDPSHFPAYSQKKHTQTGAATYKVGGDLDIGHHHVALPRLPDLRFEQSYLMSIKPFVTDVEPADAPDEVTSDGEKVGRRALLKEGILDNPGPYGVPIRIDWMAVSWVTLRDQVISPLLQGAVWGTASIFLIPLSQALRSKFMGGTRPPKPRQVAPPATSTEVGWWRSWVRSFSGALQTNTVLK